MKRSKGVDSRSALWKLRRVNDENLRRPLMERSRSSISMGLEYGRTRDWSPFHSEIMTKRHQYSLSTARSSIYYTCVHFFRSGSTSDTIEPRVHSFDDIKIIILNCNRLYSIRFVLGTHGVRFVYFKLKIRWKGH